MITYIKILKYWSVKPLQIHRLQFFQYSKWCVKYNYEDSEEEGEFAQKDSLQIHQVLTLRQIASDKIENEEFVPTITYEDFSTKIFLLYGRLIRFNSRVADSILGKSVKMQYNLRY